MTGPTPNLKQAVMAQVTVTPQLPPRALAPISIRCSKNQPGGMFWYCRPCMDDLDTPVEYGWAATVANACTTALLHLADKHPVVRDA